GAFLARARTRRRLRSGDAEPGPGWQHSVANRHQPPGALAATAARTSRSRSARENGFWRNPVSPARARDSGIASSVYPLQRITGTLGLIWRIAAITPRPPISGLVTSRF